MMAATTIAVTVGTMATIAIADDRALSGHLQDLLDHGFVVIAEGKLIEGVRCDPELAPITPREIARGYRCPTGEVMYGSFKRLRGSDGEFVCVSSRDSACYPSQSSN
jgi:hypothetical protein